MRSQSTLAPAILPASLGGDGFSAPRVLIVEDSIEISDPLAESLVDAGMNVEQVENGATALAVLREFRPDVALVDPRLPDMDGFALVERLARDGDCGIIMMSAKAPASAMVLALERGADDFVCNPAAMPELVARIRALYRRLNRNAVGATASRVAIDSASRCILGLGKLRTPLTEAEYVAIETLIEAAGASVSLDWLGRVALKRPISANDRSVDQLVLKLRRKLAQHGLVGRVILSSRGLGYVIPDPRRFQMIGGLAGDA